MQFSVFPGYDDYAPEKLEKLYGCVVATFTFRPQKRLKTGNKLMIYISQGHVREFVFTENEICQMSPGDLVFQVSRSRY